ncbi:MAG TPA: efflux RND transporter periplasmic adaptor subunit [Candidatus Brocadiia bacterium]|nr:efflux RND transporter periplasmic adaptor subunit [Candidatus Brocadiales bacterium]
MNTRTIICALSVTFLSLGTFSFLPWRWSNNVEDSSISTVPVRQGDLVVKIAETGVLRSLRSVSLASEIPSNKAKIAWITPEGSYVEKDAVLVQFDKAPFEEAIERYEAAVKEAEATLAQANEDLKLEQANSAQAVETAKHKVFLLEMGLKNILEGEGYLKLKEIEAQKEQADAELVQAESYFRDLKELLQKGWVSQNELDKARLQLDKAKSAAELTGLRANIYKEYVYPAEKEKAEAELRKAKDELVELQKMTYYRILRAQAGLDLAGGKLAVAKKKLEDTKNELEKTTLKAPIAGFVVYKELYISGEKRKVRIGDSVWSDQDIILIPDISKMAVETRIREVDIHKVKTGQDVSVRVDAYPDLALHGNVELIGTLAEKEEGLNAVSKFFNLYIIIKESDQRLRPGMTARAELLVDKLKNVLYVPLEAVYLKDGAYVCYVLSNDTVSVRTVTLGNSNDEFVTIESGLKEDERVCLTEPARMLEIFEKTTGTITSRESSSHTIKYSLDHKSIKSIDSN